MILWFVKWILISLSLIFLIHYLYNYLKNTLTNPIQLNSNACIEKRYDDILAPIKDHKDEKAGTKLSFEVPAMTMTNENVQTTTNNDNNNDAGSMQNELQSFLSELKRND